MINTLTINKYLKENGKEPNKNYLLKDKGEGNYIAQWGYQDLEKPDIKTLGDIQKEIEKDYLSDKRKQEIYTRLDAIDRESIRPLRAKLNGTNTQADDAELAELETEAQTLRDELAAL